MRKVRKEKEFKRYLGSMFTKTQIHTLAFCLLTDKPVCFYGSGLGKSTLVKILRNSGFKNVYAPEDSDTDAAQCSVVDTPGAIAFCIKKGSFDRPLPKNPFSKDIICSVFLDVLTHTH